MSLKYVLGLNSVRAKYKGLRMRQDRWLRLMQQKKDAEEAAGVTERQRRYRRHAHMSAGYYEKPNAKRNFLGEGELSFGQNRNLGLKSFSDRALLTLLELGKSITGEKRVFIEWYTYRIEMSADLTHCLISLLICVLYVYESYVEFISTKLYAVHLACGVFCTAYITMGFYVSER